MKPEPDPVAIDLICRLTTIYSESLWRKDYGGEYVGDTYYCSSCQATKYPGDHPVHAENCKAVKLIIESLNYVASHA